MGRPLPLQLLFASAVVAMGAVEGYLMFRTGTFLPAVIRAQMTFESMAVMKLFVTAVGSSMLFQSVLDFAHPDGFDYSRVFKWNRFGTPRVVTGAIALGVGMTLSGSGPTMLPTQLGAIVDDTALWTMAGVVIGAAVFAQLEARFLSTDSDVKSEGDAVHVLDVHLTERKKKRMGGGADAKHHKVSYWQIAGPISIVLLAAVAALEFAVPHAADMDKLFAALVAGKGAVSAAEGRKFAEYFGAVSPIAPGLIIGLTQVPLRLIAYHGQGGSTGLMVLVSTITLGYVSPRHRIRSFQQSWQMLYVWVGTFLGAILGSHRDLGYSLWGTAAGASIGDIDLATPHFTEAYCLAGGVLMVLGSRLAGGCACGHGVSGSSELSMESLVATACIFGGAMASAAVLRMM